MSALKVTCLTKTLDGQVSHDQEQILRSRVAIGYPSLVQRCFHPPNEQNLMCENVRLRESEGGTDLFTCISSTAANEAWTPPAWTLTKRVRQAGASTRRDHDEACMMRGIQTIRNNL